MIIPVCRQGNNTLNIVNVPIVFVPGVMGSRLFFSDIEESWNPDSIWDMVHWLRISAERARRELHFQSPAQVMTDRPAEKLAPNEKDRGWEGVAWGVYGSFLRSLNDNPFSPALTPVYAVGYDWRQSNRDSGQYVAEQIRNIIEKEEAQKVLIITHSMGGLVTRAALKSADDISGKLLGVIHVVQPSQGAVVAYRRLFTGATKDWDGDWGFRTIIGKTPSKFSTIMSGMRGPMELLPNNDYRDTGGVDWLSSITYEETDGQEEIPSGFHYWTGNVYDIYRMQASPPGIVDYNPNGTKTRAVVKTDLMQRVTEAEEFHNWLGQYKHDKTWAIYGTGLDTDMAIEFDQTADADFRGAVPTRRDQGDGTVPGPSGGGLFAGQAYEVTDPLPPEARQFVVSGQDHQSIFESADTRRIITGLFSNIL